MVLLPRYMHRLLSLLKTNILHGPCPSLEYQWNLSPIASQNLPVGCHCFLNQISTHESMKIVCSTVSLWEGFSQGRTVPKQQLLRQPLDHLELAPPPVSCCHRKNSKCNLNHQQVNLHGTTVRQRGFDVQISRHC